MFKINDTIYYTSSGTIEKDVITKIRMTEDANAKNVEYFLHARGEWVETSQISKTFDTLAAIYVKELDDELTKRKDYIKVRKNELK